MERRAYYRRATFRVIQPGNFCSRQVPPGLDVAALIRDLPDIAVPGKYGNTSPRNLLLNDL